MIYRKLVPASLLGRSLIIIFIPLISVVIITTLIFYQTSWNIISKRLTQSVVADINVIVKLIDQDLKIEAIKIAKEDFKMKAIYKEDTGLDPSLLRHSRGILSKRLKQSLENLNKPFFYDLTNIAQGVKIAIQIKNDLLVIYVDKDRLYSGSAFVFLLWMIFASLILLILSFFFMKGQVRPLKRLAIIAETFGRGLDAPEVKESGALEIRQTTNAFNKMRLRIKRFLKQRTDMLAGVSHDLKTPLTRMKLQLSLMKDDVAKKELQFDVDEMTAMLNSYVNFVHGEAPEPIVNIKLNDFIEDICKNLKIQNQKLVTNFDIEIITSGRQIQLKRAIKNIIENSLRYATEINISLSIENESCHIAISDNGSGVPEKNYEDIFKPFFTLDPSRNKLKGESGLGLTISRDIIRSHGGDIKLSGSDLGGLKTTINIPL